MYYVAKADDGELCIVETTLLQVKGTWHYWRDQGGHEWRTRGLSIVRGAHYTAYLAYLQDNPDDARAVVTLAWRDSYQHGQRDGIEHARRECQLHCPANQPVQPTPKRRSFVRRLLSGQPFAAV